MGMSQNSDKMKSELQSLISEGMQLKYSLMHQSGELEEQLKNLNVDASKLPTFSLSYEPWYTHSLSYVKKFAPDRIKDFTDLYRNENRKSINFVTYTISDAILGVTVGHPARISPVDAFPKFQQQLSILKGVVTLIDSSIYSMEFELQANIFDSELDASKELWKNGFLRASGVICGVILEKHLKQVCATRQTKISKKSPTLNDFAELLKNNKIIGVPEWRHIQLMADIRNSCSHDRESEPTKDQVKDLLDGTDKIIKTIF